MKNSSWIVLLAMLALLLGGCEREEPQVEQVEPAKETPAAAQEETRAEAVQDRETEMEATQEKDAALPVMNERIEEEAEQRDVQMAQQEGDQAAGATGPTGEMPGSVTYDADFGAVTFDHAMHAEALACDSCHISDPPERIVIDKERAHDMCKGCHQEQGAGPTGCRECHQKE